MKIGAIQGISSSALVRWSAMLACAAVTMTALAGVWRSDGVWWTQFEVVLLPPVDKVSPNSLVNPQDGLIATAGVLVTEFNRGPTAAYPASSSATLFGQGVREGHSVKLRNTGGQWTRSFGQPVIRIEVVADTPEQLARQSRDIRRQLTAALARHQRKLQVSPQQAITLSGWPEAPVAQFITGNSRRAVVAVLLIGASGLFGLYRLLWRFDRQKWLGQTRWGTCSRPK